LVTTISDGSADIYFSITANVCEIGYIRSNKVRRLMSFIELADIAAEQWGLITTAQAEAAGSSRKAVGRLARAGTLERLAQGVYRLAGTPADPRDDLRAAWLALDPGRVAGTRLRDDVPEVVSHRSAAVLYELGDLDADRHEFTVAGRRQTRRPDIRFHKAGLSAADWGIVDGLPCTTVVRTITDLAADRTDGGHLAGVVRDALTVKHVDVDQLARALTPYAARYGVADGDGEALLTRFLEEAGVPEATRRTIELTTSGDRRTIEGTA
jgi:predicted transcriptional regulator of viral defense system